MIYCIVLLLPVLIIVLILRFITVRLYLKLTAGKKPQTKPNEELVEEADYEDHTDYQTNRIHPFLDELNNIDFQYLFFFLFREPVTPEDVRDRLSNHYKFEIECGKAYFAFLPTSDLPSAIRRKCNEKFIRYFENGVLL